MERQNMSKSKIERTNLYGWTDEVLLEQFLIRVKIFLIKRKINAVEIEFARHRIERPDELLDLFQNAIAKHVKQIKSKVYPYLKDIFLSPEEVRFVEMPHGHAFDSDSLEWADLFQKPIKLVTNHEMSEKRDSEKEPFAPFIKDGRLFISIHLSANKEILKAEFSKLLGEQSIPFKSEEEKQVTATPLMINDNCFIQILDYRIKNGMCLDNSLQATPKYTEEEIMFVKELKLKAIRYEDSDPNTSTVRRSARNSLILLHSWLINPEFLTKLSHR
jgi:hypothetical protein